ncbi:MAG: rod-binding protein [Myxococcota bacterium]
MKISGMHPIMVQTTRATTRANNPLATPPGTTLVESALADSGVPLEELALETEQAQRSGRRASIRKAAKEFEAHFLTHMFKVMRETVPKDGLFKQSFSNDTYTSMLDQEYARTLSDGGGFGLAAVLERQFAGGLAGTEAPHDDVLDADMSDT